MKIPDDCREVLTAAYGSVMLLEVCFKDSFYLRALVACISGPAQ